MHLLQTETYRLRTFVGYEIPPYAILSHVWGTNEVSFQDIEHIARGVGDGYDKVRGTCSIAKAHGFDYVWIDTCCIDKTSSSELSEAINSMYHWYQESGACYAYLADVPSKAINYQTGTVCSEFFSSKWYTRGWTLQELIAPYMVIFFDKTWQEIGTKSSLTSTISKITGIPDSILQGDNPEIASIAQRISWAAKRQTTRVEDQAYCLLGILGVNMPMLYGEGERAFIRLQEEIMKVSDDHSLFAWALSDRCGGLLAPSPAAFSNSGNIIPSASVLSSRAMTMNNQGIHLTLRVEKVVHYSPVRGHNFQLAILPCVVENDSRKMVGIYVRPVSKYFERTMSHELPEIHLDGYHQSKYDVKNICVRRERQIHRNQLTLTRAAEKGNEAAVRLLLERGVKPESQDEDGWTALVVAAKNGHKAIVRLLLERGVDPTSEDRPGKTALAMAAENGHEAIVCLLLERGAGPGFSGWVALAMAAENGHDAVVRLLLESGVDPESEDRSGRRPLVMAAKNGHEAVVWVLLKGGAKPCGTALAKAAENGHEAVVRLLLESGAKPDGMSLATVMLLLGKTLRGTRK